MIQLSLPGLEKVKVLVILSKDGPLIAIDEPTDRIVDALKSYLPSFIAAIFQSDITLEVEYVTVDGCNDCP